MYNPTQSRVSVLLTDCGYIQKNACPKTATFIPMKAAKSEKSFSFLAQYSVHTTCLPLQSQLRA